MAWQLTRDDLDARMKGHGPSNYLTIYNVMKGVTLATGAYTFALFLREDVFPFKRLPFFVASFGAMILTYDAAHVGTLVINWMPTWRDILFPFSVAVNEFLLFFVLQTESTVTLWNPVFAVFALSCALLLSNVLKSLDASQYAPDLRDFCEAYRRSMQRDRKMSALFGSIWVFFSVALFLVPALQAWQWVLGFGAIGVMVMAVRDQENDRGWIRTCIQRVSPHDN